MRPWINRHAATVMLVALVVLVAAVGWSVTTWRASRKIDPGRQWFYDPGTRALFAGPADALPPILAPSQAPDETPMGVAAHVFTCGNCEPSEWIVLYLEKWTPEAAERVRAVRRGAGISREGLQQLSATGRLIKRPGDASWVQFDGEPGRRILALEATLCDGSPAGRCLPP